MSELILYAVRRNANRLHLTDVSSKKLKKKEKYHFVWCGQKIRCSSILMLSQNCAHAMGILISNISLECNLFVFKTVLINH